MNGNKTHHINFLAEILGIPLVKITWWSDGLNGRIGAWFLRMA